MIDKLHKVNIFIFLIILFPGVFKMAIGISSPIVNVGSFLIFLFFTIKLYSMRNMSNLIVQFIYFIFFIIFLMSFYAFFSSEQLIFRSLDYLIKGYIFLVTSVLVIYSFRGRDFNYMVNLVIVVSVILTIMKSFGLIDYEKTNTNYLIYALLLGLSIVFLFYDILFKSEVYYIKLFKLSLAMYFILMNLFTGSRGALLFSLLIIIVMYIKKIKYINILKTIIYTSLSVVSIYILINYIIENIQIHSWLQYKLQRLFSEQITEEPRYELYSNAFTYLFENINIFGFGFHASQYISTSWDPSLPYLESFPLEIIFNYGLFGLFIVFTQFFFIAYFFSRDIYLYPNTFKSLMMFLFVYLNFAKGWSVYNGMVCFPLMAIVLIIYNYERKTKC